MKTVLPVTLVRSTDPMLSVPVGSLGIVEEDLEGAFAGRYAISWLGPMYGTEGALSSPVPTPGGSSLPVAGEQIEVLGRLYLPMPPAIPPTAREELLLDAMKQMANIGAEAARAARARGYEDPEGKE